MTSFRRRRVENDEIGGCRPPWVLTSVVTPLRPDRVVDGRAGGGRQRRGWFGAGRGGVYWIPRTYYGLYRCYDG
jgi:hypothetical protein